MTLHYTKHHNWLFVLLLLAFVQCVPNSDALDEFLNKSLVTPSQITIEKMGSANTNVLFPLEMFGDSEFEIKHAQITLHVNNLTEIEKTRVETFLKPTHTEPTIKIPITNISKDDTVTIDIELFSGRKLTYVGTISATDDNHALLQSSFEAGGAAYDIETFRNQERLTMASAYLDAKDRIVRASINQDLSQIRIERFTANGQLDTSFGQGTGTVITQLNPLYDSDKYKLQKVRWIADEANGFFWAIFDAQVAAVTDFPLGQTTTKTIIFRFDENGSPDSLFGQNGVLPIDYELYNKSTAGAVDDDGNLYLSLTVIFLNNMPDNPYGEECFVFKIEPSGNLDPNYGQGGIMFPLSVAMGPSNISAMRVTPDNKLLTAVSTSESFYIARYSEDGSMDEAFGTAGFTEIPYEASNAATIAALDISQHGSITAVAQSPLSGEFYILQLNELGLADESFGDKGLVTHVLAPAKFYVKNAIKLDDERLLVYGQRNSDMSLMMFIPMGGHDLDFADQGILTAVAGTKSLITSASINADGNDILISGSGLSARINIDTGEIDPTFGSPLSGTLFSE